MVLSLMEGIFLCFFPLGHLLFFFYFILMIQGQTLGEAEKRWVALVLVLGDLMMWMDGAMTCTEMIDVRQKGHKPAVKRLRPRTADV